MWFLSTSRIAAVIFSNTCLRRVPPGRSQLVSFIKSYPPIHSLSLYLSAIFFQSAINLFWLAVLSQRDGLVES